MPKKLPLAGVKQSAEQIAHWSRDSIAMAICALKTSYR